MSVDSLASPRLGDTISIGGSSTNSRVDGGAHVGGRMLTAWRLVRFVVAGGSSLLLQLVFQWAFITLLGLRASAAIVVAYELALLAHFFINNRWVFEQRRSSWCRLLEFQVAALTAELITFAVAFVVLSGPIAAFFGPLIAPYAATIIGTGVAFAWNAGTSFFWIWRPRPLHEPVEAVEAVVRRVVPQVQPQPEY